VIVEVNSLSYRYGDRAALSDVSFAVPEREIFGVLGPNGGGKSTLFRILATLQTPAGGWARLAGFDVERQPADVRRRIGVVFQSQSLDRKLTVAENLRAQGRLFGLSGKDLVRRAGEAMTRLGIDDRAADLVGTLSGGLRRRVEIAKSLLHQPSLLIMDEPSTGLDPAVRREVWNYIEELRSERGITVLLTTHLLEEADRCDRLLLLHDGRVVAEGTPAALKSRIGGDVVVLETEEPASLAAQMREKLGVNATSVNGSVRVEIGNGHRFVAEVVEAFPGFVRGVALHKPTLEDVFLDETGSKLQ
jgi:ABC-2 type transport system ATP-binding protein